MNRKTLERPYRFGQKKIEFQNPRSSKSSSCSEVFPVNGFQCRTFLDVDPPNFCYTAERSHGEMNRKTLERPYRFGQKKIEFQNPRSSKSSSCSEVLPVNGFQCRTFSSVCPFDVILAIFLCGISFRDRSASEFFLVRFWFGPKKILKKRSNVPTVQVAQPREFRPTLPREVLSIPEVDGSEV